MSIICCIRYHIEPTQTDQFLQYAKHWYRIIPRLGGQLLEYYLPHEGDNGTAYGIIEFDSLAAYEQYRIRLSADAEARQNFQFAKEHGFIRQEKRLFLKKASDIKQLAHDR